MKLTSASYLFIILALLFTAFTACSDDDEDEEPEFPALDRGQTEVNRMLFIFKRNTANGLVVQDTAEVIDSDGPGGNAPTIVDTLDLLWFRGSAGYSYDAEIKFFLNQNEVTGIITGNAKDYIVCYRQFQTQELLLNDRGEDADGYPLGISTEWQTRNSGGSTNGSGIIYITLNYQAVAKDGLCDPGVRIFECNLPYRLN